MIPITENEIEHFVELPFENDYPIIGAQYTRTNYQEEDPEEIELLGHFIEEHNIERNIDNLRWIIDIKFG